MIDRILHIGSKKPLETERLYIRYPRLSDWQAWANVRQISSAYLIPWEPVWSHDSLSKANFRARLRQYARDSKEDSGFAFFIFRKEDNQLIGSVTLSNIRRGVAQTGTIGYWTGEPYARQGYMFEGLCGLIPSLFDQYGLRRVEAACIPENNASASLLEKVGFKPEGRAREYLCINGVWRDHLLYAILNSDPIGGGTSRVTKIA